MRPKRLSFEQLVNQNIRELLDDENSLNQLEMRIEKRHEALTRKKRDQDAEFYSNER
ncbi:FbpB family small basic protein [Oceanobacillus luteolus]|uniref:FbpB family small basic protein n=1 Tax=Oceanobacillus luteolus TaxID=1274358 RepID=A0ABW4HSN7_9BACI|nr:FbpB family small basic protein [Oceanobacillus luteolus]MCM3739868.1 FbpB family small basic protein [Oceanobacillus luteolus]